MHPMHPPSKELEYSNITDGIYIGTNQCCQTHFDEMLQQKEGIEADISLEEERIDQPFGVHFYIWLPVRNFAAPTPEQFTFGVSALEQLVILKKKVYVHCQNGHGRAPTLVAAYLVKKGTTVEEALARIRSKRPAIHLNEAQLQALQTYAQSLMRT